MSADDILYEPIVSEEDLEREAEIKRRFYRRLGEIIRKHTYQEFYKAAQRADYEVCQDSGS